MVQISPIRHCTKVGVTGQKHNLLTPRLQFEYEDRHFVHLMPKVRRLPIFGPTIWEDFYLFRYCSNVL